MDEKELENLERLVKLEGEVKGLKEIFLSFVQQATENNAKTNEKLDTLIRENSKKPDFEYCTERKRECTKKFDTISDEMSKIKESSIPKNVAYLISGLTGIIGVLSTALITLLVNFL